MEAEAIKERRERSGMSIFGSSMKIMGIQRRDAARLEAATIATLFPILSLSLPHGT